MTQRQRPIPDPAVAALVRAQRAALSRRAFLGGGGALGLGALLAACGTGGTASGGTGGGTSSRPKPAVDRSASEKLVNWANWTLYLDYDDKTKSYPTLTNFTKTTGIKATYAEDIEDNDTYYAKIAGQLKNSQDIGKDIIVFTDWMATRVINEGYVQKLDHAKIPSWTQLLTPLKNVGFDPGRNYSLTWQSGFTGIAYNKTAVKTPVRTVADLWRPDLKGRVEVLSEMRDTIGLIMSGQGVDVSKAFTSAQFGNALDELQKQLDSGQIRQVKGNSYKEDLISEDALACFAWSGDVTQLNAENGNKWEFVIPDTGGMLWSDNLMIPIGSPHKENAEILMNYYYQPKVAAQVAQYVNYVCPVQGARAEMEKLDPELVTNKLIFPDDDYLKQVKGFRPLSPAEEKQFNADFSKVLGV